MYSCSLLAVECLNVDISDIDVTVTIDSHVILKEVTPVETDRSQVIFIPQTPGIYTVNVLIGGSQPPGVYLICGSENKS